jgi:hypothetical protein
MVVIPILRSCGSNAGILHLLSFAMPHATDLEKRKPYIVVQRREKAVVCHAKCHCLATGVWLRLKKWSGSPLLRQDEARRVKMVCMNMPTTKRFSDIKSHATVFKHIFVTSCMTLIALY